MANQVLARKWRPRAFSSLIGQDHVVRALSHALETQRLHHAYLFTGTRGVGKTTIARILAKSLNCERGISATPCGVCAACVELDQGRFPDYLELDAASNRGVEEMTQLLEAAVYAPTAGRYKVYVIDEVHMLSNHAFNAMLKTLEEPPPHVIFILATTDPQKVPVTVLSRCMQFNLKNMPVPAIVDHLAYILGQEAIAFDATATTMIARSASGSMRDALSILDQAIAFGGGRVDADAVALMLGAIDKTDLFALLDSLLANEGEDALARAQVMLQNSVPFDRALSDLAALLHRVALAQVATPSSEGEFEAADLVRLAQLMAPETVQALYQIAIFGQRDLPLAPDPLSGFTMTLLRMMAFLPGASDSGGAAHRTAAPPAIAMPIRSAAALTASLVMLCAGLIWLAQAPEDAAFVVHLLGPTIVIGLGLGGAFIAGIEMSVHGVSQTDSGLAGGLVNTSQQIGGALGLALIFAISIMRTDALSKAGLAATTALNGGYSTSYVIAAVIALLAAGVSLRGPSES